MSTFEEIKRFLENIKEENIRFKRHFYIKTKDRPISDNLVRKYLKKTSRLLKVKKQKAKRKGEKKYKLWIKLSKKYNLVIILIISRESLYIISSWNTLRKWKKTTKK